MSDVKRVRIEWELEDGTTHWAECTGVVKFNVDIAREPRETTWEHFAPTARTYEPSPLIQLKLDVTAKAAERSAT